MQYLLTSVCYKQKTHQTYICFYCVASSTQHFVFRHVCRLVLKCGLSRGNAAIYTLSAWLALASSTCEVRVEEQLAREHAWWKLVPTPASAQTTTPTTEQFTSSFQTHTHKHKHTHRAFRSSYTYVCLRVCMYVYTLACGEHHQFASSRTSESAVASKRSTSAIWGEQVSRA